MKLNELLQDIFKVTGPTGSLTIQDDYTLTGKALELFKDRILECEEFENVEELIILDEPSRTNTLKMVNEIKFGKKMHLWSISLSPSIYEPEEMTKPVKDGITVLPTFFDTKSFLPMKGITIFWNPEISELSEEEKKEYLIGQFKKALKNPDDYKIPPKRFIMIRGTFEIINKNDLEYMTSMEIVL